MRSAFRRAEALSSILSELEREHPGRGDDDRTGDVDGRDGARIGDHIARERGDVALRRDGRGVVGPRVCKIACNNGPLRGCYASNNDPL